MELPVNIMTSTTTTAVAAQNNSHLFQNAAGFDIIGGQFVLGDVHNHHTTPNSLPSTSLPSLNVLDETEFSESEIYCSQLLRQKRGFPLYVPAPQPNLPPAYQGHGIGIGDVGSVMPEGIFDFFFNIFLPPEHPINANRTPEDFSPMLPYDSMELVQHDYDPGNYVSSPTVQKLDLDAPSDDFPGGHFIFGCNGSQGAVLALPDGGHLQKLRNVENMRTYAAKHADNWYKYINGARGRGLANGDLYLVTGCEKARSWGMASYQTVREEFGLTFKPTARVGTTDELYRWSGTPGRKNPAKRKSHDPASANHPVNQTTFIHGWSISLPTGLWGRLFGTVETSSIVDFQSRMNPTGGSCPSSSQGSSFSWSWSLFGGGGPTGGKRHAKEHEGVVLADFSPIAMVFNPAKLINEYILHKTPHATVVMTHDDDWCDILGDDSELLNPLDLLQRINDQFTITEKDGATFLVSVSAHSASSSTDNVPALTSDTCIVGTPSGTDFLDSFPEESEYLNSTPETPMETIFHQEDFSGPQNMGVRSRSDQMETSEAISREQIPVMMSTHNVERNQTEIRTACRFFCHSTEEYGIDTYLSRIPSGTTPMQVLLHLGPEITSDPRVVGALLERFNISPRENLIAEIMTRLAAQGKPECDADVDLDKWLADNADGVGEPVWPVILWVAFQVKASYWPPSSSADMDTLLDIIEKSQANVPWQWDDADELLLRQTFLSQDSTILSWIDRYPPAWREYIHFPEGQEWARLKALTRQTSRPRSDPPEYDSAIRVAALVLWTSWNPISVSPKWDTILTLDRFVADMVGNVYMVDQLSRPLPQRFICCVFACVLKSGNPALDDFRTLIDGWKSWDVMTCLIKFRSVLGTTSEFSKLIEDQALPQSVVDVVIDMDIRCICAQIVGIIRSPDTYQGFIAARDDDAQQLLDLLQDLLDYPPLDTQSRPIIWKAMRKLSKKSDRLPRCYAIPGFELNGSPVTGGAYSDIWKCNFQNETVCVKATRFFETSDIETLLKGFRKEALTWRQFTHPNALPFLGIYHLEDPRPRLCLVSPWMENGNIANYLEANPFGINRLTLVLDVAIGLAYLHSQNFVHGDLQALNVLVTRSGRAVIADFGQLSIFMNSGIPALSSTVQQSGGTLRWQAPELLKGSRNSVESDVYAFAGVCYETLTGKIPFFEVNDHTIVGHILSGNIPQKSSSISDDIWTLMEECWHTDPEKRPAAKDIVVRLSDQPIGAIPTKAASDWERSYTAKFRSSFQDHTLFLLRGKIDDCSQVRPPLADLPTQKGGETCQELHKKPCYSNTAPTGSLSATSSSSTIAGNIASNPSLASPSCVVTSF